MRAECNFSHNFSCSNVSLHIRMFVLYMFGTYERLQISPNRFILHKSFACHMEHFSFIFPLIVYIKSNGEKHIGSGKIKTGKSELRRGILWYLNLNYRFLNSKEEEPSWVVSQENLHRLFHIQSPSLKWSHSRSEMSCKLLAEKCKIFSFI